MIACMNVNQMAEAHLAVTRKDVTCEAQIWVTLQEGEELEIECNRE